MNNIKRKDRVLVQLVMSRLQERGYAPTIEPGHGSHMKVRWVAPGGRRQLMIVPRYTGSWRQEHQIVSLLNRLLRKQEAVR